MTDTLAEFDRRLGLPMRLRIAPELWAAAFVLGRLRMLVNDTHRAAHRDRGQEKNVLNDLQGALGELVGMWLLHSHNAGRPSRGVLDLERSVDLPDLVTISEPAVLLDAKCHLHEPQKKLFAVNKRAAERSARRGVHGFLPLVTEHLAGRALLGRLVPINELRSWPVQLLAPHRDPAHTMGLGRFARTYLLTSIPPPASGSASTGWGPSVLEADTVARIERAVDTDLLARMRQEHVSLDGLHYDEVQRRLLALVPSVLAPQSDGAEQRPDRHEPGSR